jgi:ATP-dependent Clp protease ATP-binding subunit ClpB
MTTGTPELLVADERPGWLREVDLALTAHPQLLLTGNVRDLYRLPDPAMDGSVRFMTLIEALWTVAAARSFDLLLSYYSGVGIEVAARRGEDVPQSLHALLSEAGVELGRILLPSQLRDLLAAVVDSRRRRPQGPAIGLVFADAARLFTGELVSSEERLLLAEADRLAYQAVPVGPVYNTVVWVLDRERDLPSWFASANHTLRTTAIPEPDLDERTKTARILVSGLATVPEDPAEREGLARRFADLSHGMHVRGMRDIVRLAGAAGLPADRLEDAIRAYRIGVPDNPWQNAELWERLKGAEDQLGHRVLGQPDAVRRVLEILTRSVTGLAGAHTGARDAPRGVLVFAGPTGVGKTELAKALAELLFGDENAYLRFDMSEFSAEHAEARLIGAPPGFIGYDAGGELTNGIREHPFRVVLFDEIEKAHPRLLDKFLQILDDGRLTDSRGGTVHFTEALIVFTTNLGIVVPDEDNKPVENVTPDNTLPELQQAVGAYIEKFFRHGIGRPELYNRLQQSIVVFDFLRPEIAAQIVDRAIGRVVDTVRRRYDAQLEFTDEAADGLRELATFDLGNGGRGIVSMVGRYLVDPLSRELFANPPEPGKKLVITGIEPIGQSWRLVVE